MPSYTIAEDTSTSVATGRYGSFGYTVTQAPSHGSLYAYQPAPDAGTGGGGTYFRYTPYANYTGPDSFTISDNHGISTFGIYMTPMSDAPEAADDQFTGASYQVAAADLLRNDRDVDGESLTVASVQGAVNGSVELKDGVVTFTPTDPAYRGDAAFTYTVADPTGLTDTANVMLKTTAPPAGAATLNLSGNVSGVENQSGWSNPLVFTIGRDGDLNGVSEVSWFVWHETTTASDLLTRSGSVRFAAGESSKQISVYVTPDTTVEPDEVFHVSLYDAKGAAIGANDGRGVIVNDDGAVDSQPFISADSLGVNEAALTSGAARDTDVIKLTAADGVDDFKVEGRSVITDGVFSPISFKTPAGATLAITAYDAATKTLSVSYSLDAAIDHTGTTASVQNVRQKDDRLTLELTDQDGDYFRSMLVGSIYDDAPIAQNDSDVAVVGGAVARGNVITDAAPGDAGDSDTGADRVGADAPLRVTAVRSGPVEDTTPDANGDFVSTGRFGTLTLNADGAYTYILFSNPEDGVTDSFGYTVRDADGSVSGASLSIQVQGGQNPQGQVLRADQAGDTLTGGAGADTLYASQGPDQLTGGGGADQFAFEALPWRAGVVTDFVDGSDKIDLRALLQASGYSGADAVADRYVSFESDGSGGTKVMYDTDGPGTAQAWSFHITTLQGVAPSSLSNADLVGGSTGGGETVSGQVLTSDQYADTLAGGAGNDTLNAGQGPDQLTGAGGADRFVFGKAPWNAGVITDFAVGSDKIDVSALLDAYSGSNPLADGWMRLDAEGGSTKVYVDIDGAGGEWPFLITTLQGVAPSSVGLGDFIV